MNKYRIEVEDLYNFNETGFIISIIIVFMVIIYLDRYGKAKSI